MIVIFFADIIKIIIVFFFFAFYFFNFCLDDFINLLEFWKTF